MIARSLYIGICLFLLLTISAYSIDDIFSETPTVNLTTPTSVTIFWKTTIPTLGTLVVTDSNGKLLWNSKEVSNPSFHHYFHLPLLKPQTSYGYSVVIKTSEGVSTTDRASFSTAVNPETPFRFATLSDCRGRQNGVNVDIFSKIIKRVVDAKPSLMFFEGDLISGYCHETLARVQFNQWKKVVSPLSSTIPIYPGMGNHDSGVTVNGKPNGEVVLASEFLLPQNGPESYKGVVFSVDYGNSHFVMLDADDHKFPQSIDPEQMEWLEKDLAATKQLHRFVFVHDPLYPCGAHIHEALDVHPEIRDQLLRIFDKYGVEAIFCGHEHNYDRKNLDTSLNPVLHRTIYQVKNGTCGASIYKANKDTQNQMAFVDNFNYVLVDVNGPTVKVTACDIDGKVIDQFSYKL